MKSLHLFLEFLYCICHSGLSIMLYPYSGTKLVQNIKISKTCLKWPLKKKTKNLFSIPIIAVCRSKVLQNAPREHSAIILLQESILQ